MLCFVDVVAWFTVVLLYFITLSGSGLSSPQNSEELARELSWKYLDVS